MKFKVDPDKGLLVKDPMVGYPVSSEFGRKIIDLSLKEQGTLPRIAKVGGEESVLVEIQDGQWHDVDELLGRLFVEEERR